MSDHRTGPDIWTAMLRARRCHYRVRPLKNPGLLAMLSIWDKVGSPLMREWSIEIAEFAADLLLDLEGDLREGSWELEREVLPTILSLLIWTNEGASRIGEPENFMSDVIATLRQGSATLARTY